MTDQYHQLDVLSRLGIGLWVPRYADAGMSTTTNTSADGASGQIAERKQYDGKYSAAVDAATQSQTLDATPVKSAQVDAVMHDATIIHASEAGFNAAQNGDLISAAAPSMNGDTVEPNLIEGLAADNHMSNDAAINEHDKHKRYAFNWYAITFNRWILLVDDASINHEKLALLWQNIQKGLSHIQASELHHLAFPLIEVGVGSSSEPTEAQAQMMHLPLATASIAGWLFSIKQKLLAQQKSRSINLTEDDINIGLLTDLPNELATNDMQRLPSLTELFEEPLLKRQFWRIISAP